MSCRPLTPEDRRTINRLRRFMFASLLFYFAGNFLTVHYRQGALNLVLGTVTGVCFFSAMALAGAMAYRQMDEFQRILLTRSFLLGTLVTLAGVTVWGYLEAFAAAAPHWHLQPFAIPGALVVLTALFKVILFRRNRAPMPPAGLA